MRETNLNSETDNASILLSVNKLNVFYGRKHAVEDLTIEVQAGMIFGLLGPNGAGKTSTLSAIEGLLKPQSGSIRVAGIDLYEDPIKAKAYLGVQLQSTSFQSELTIYEIIRLYAGLYGVTISKPEIMVLLKSIQLEEEASRRIKELSGGQQQRVSLLIATIHDPLLVLHPTWQGLHVRLSVRLQTVIRPPGVLFFRGFWDSLCFPLFRLAKLIQYFLYLRPACLHRLIDQDPDIAGGLVDACLGNPQPYLVELCRHSRHGRGELFADLQRVDVAGLAIQDLREVFLHLAPGLAEFAPGLGQTLGSFAGRRVLAKTPTHGHHVAVYALLHGHQSPVHLAQVAGIGRLADGGRHLANDLRIRHIGQDFILWQLLQWRGGGLVGGFDILAGQPIAIFRAADQLLAGSAAVPSRGLTGIGLQSIGDVAAHGSGRAAKLGRDFLDR